ncbi:hypothetical protein HMPREF1531_01416 [Propionibacterium sp. oral taxon 192 str. F0372]|uniref:PP2C family protein-serine/threonine phosphatase n=1 Tax=Propionibacterium sp. oral taxon 192 TaxID=671222 RepID=UPI0003536187|nr:protein phosphatase 2C domain-containing protein [Propionibacterium sp. oral taxon 192]EPH03357.1 hypothetical protein HMPREF1531_01416 [Propionibacterium sp. oral taxon 192 str. F0372]
MNEINWSQPPSANTKPKLRLSASHVPDEAPGVPGGVSQPVRTFLPQPITCAKCSGEIDFDGYCLICGEKAADPRMHYEMTSCDWVAGVCDRGVRHPGNEDALALDASAFEQGRAVLVVCDGVSMAADSAEASLSAAHAAVAAVNAAEFDWDLSPQAVQAATGEVLGGVALAANQAVLDNSDLQVQNPASCTLAIGLLNGRSMLSATVGDSRVYWLPDSGAAMQLSIDDSMAQQQMDAGMDRLTAETGEYGHVITRWLGRDAPDVRPRVSVATAEGDGWFLVCSDGLWNYASDPSEMSELVAAIVRELGEPTPLELASRLVGWANTQGGADNVTVAVARVTVEPGSETQEAAENELDSATVRLRG